MKEILIVLVFIIAVVGLYKKESWPLWTTHIIVGLLLILAIVQIIVERRKAKETSKLQHTGTLEPLSKVLFSMRDNVLPKLALGDGGTILAYTGPRSQPLFKIFDENALSIISDEGRVKVSTIIRDKTGNVVAELIENEWKVNKNSAFDRNFSKDALEVKDNTGDIVFQIRVLEDRIQFQGKFYDSKGNGVAIGKDFSGKGGVIEMTGLNHPQLELKIDPIFLYPSDNHLGEFREKKK